MADRPPGDFGRRLREARERRGVSLRQIANATKIGMSALEALERNDISRLPGGIFSRGFVRAYAEQIGADPEKTVREFIARFPHDSVTDGSPYVTTHEVDTEPPFHAGRVLLIAVPIVVVVLALIVWAIFSRN
jgi:cytoskeletal protein RodZ